MTSHRDSNHSVSPWHSLAMHGTPLTSCVALRCDPDLSPPGLTIGPSQSRDHPDDRYSSISG